MTPRVAGLNCGRLTNEDRWNRTASKARSRTLRMPTQHQWQRLVHLLKYGHNAINAPEGGGERAVREMNGRVDLYICIIQGY